VFLDRLSEDLLSRRRTEVRVVGGNDSAGNVLGELRDLISPNSASDVFPAVTDEDPYPGFLSGHIDLVHQVLGLYECVPS